MRSWFCVSLVEKALNPLQTQAMTCLFNENNFWILLSLNIKLNYFHIIFGFFIWKLTDGVEAEQISAY